MTILEEGVTYWRRAFASEMRFLVDMSEYFEAFTEAALLAEKSIVIVGWDFNGAVRLWRDEPPDGLPPAVGDFLNELAERRESLTIRILDWDYPFPYMLDRELLPSFRQDWRAHPRIEFRLDDCCPPTGSHHQKIVVIDDSIAFVGGMDFGAQRWDTSEHKVDEPRRVDPDGNTYRPFHDIQIALSGDAARCVGDLVRERWRVSTGDDVPLAEARDIWPTHWRCDGAGEVAIARTKPKYDGDECVTEIRDALAAAISSASRWIYMEDQYLTASVIGDALCESLKTEDGPEVVLVLRQSAGGWLEDNVVGTLRAKLLKRLREADRYRRLDVRCPQIGSTEIDVHSKISIYDDSLVVIGSANLSNRSMTLDSECAVLIEAKDDPDMSATVLGILYRLVGEHTGQASDEVARILDETGSLRAVIAAAPSVERRLVPLPPAKIEWENAILPASALLDPEMPAGSPPDLDSDREGSAAPRRRLARRLMVGSALAAAAAALLWSLV